MHEPLVDEKTFFDIQEILKSRASVRVKKYDFLLKGIIVCHECGKKMGLTQQRYPRKTTFYLRCNTYASFAGIGLNKPCTPHTCNLEKLTRKVLSRIRKKCREFLKMNEVQNLTDRLVLEDDEKRKNLKRELMLTEQKINEINKIIDSSFQDKAAGLLEPEDFNRIYQAKLEARKKLDVKKEALEKALTQNIPTADITSTARSFLSKKQITQPDLLHLVEKIELTKEKTLKITYKYNILNELK